MDTRTHAAAGPLVVSETNPRYFRVARDAFDGKVVYLTGSHVWDNFQDGLGPADTCADRSEHRDYRAYLDLLVAHGHNFIRLWRWEHFRSQGAGGKFHLCMSPQPWPRTGPGLAKDGKPRFDLAAFDPAYFDRLRARVVAAGERGIYVSVMLFEGFALHLSPPPDNLEGHPFHAANNVNGIGIGSLADYQSLPLGARVAELQVAYVQKVVATVGDLPNVLYEVANESSGDASQPELGDSTAWQRWVLLLVKDTERAHGWRAHPVGMTAPYPVPDQSHVNDALWTGPADWISPTCDDERLDLEGWDGGPPPGNGRWFNDPPANDGRKVVLLDTDHVAPGKGDALWVWKAFLRGHNPILMDLGLVGVPSHAAFEPARKAMGDTRRWAERISLTELAPRGELSSTGYALAKPGAEYLVLQPGNAGAASGKTIRLSIAEGRYAVEWFGVDGGETVWGETMHVERSRQVELRAPVHHGPAVLYAKSVV